MPALITSSRLTKTWIGGQPVEYPFIGTGRLTSILYFFLILILMPSQIQKKTLIKWRVFVVYYFGLVNQRRGATIIPKTQGRSPSSTLSTQSWNSTWNYLKRPMSGMQLIYYSANIEIFYIHPSLCTLCIKLYATYTIHEWYIVYIMYNSILITLCIWAYTLTYMYHIIYNWFSDIHLSHEYPCHDMLDITQYILLVLHTHLKSNHFQLTCIS